MTMTSPAHAMAYAHICDLIRAAARQRRANDRPRRRLARDTTARTVRWQGSAAARRT